MGLTDAGSSTTKTSASSVPPASLREAFRARRVVPTELCQGASKYLTVGSAGAVRLSLSKSSQSHRGRLASALRAARARRTFGVLSPAPIRSGRKRCWAALNSSNSVRRGPVVGTSFACLDRPKGINSRTLFLASQVRADLDALSTREAVLPF